MSVPYLDSFQNTDHLGNNELSVLSVAVLSKDRFLILMIRRGIANSP